MEFIILSLLVFLASSWIPKDQSALTEEEIEIILARHNYWRADVGVNEKLVGSDEMAELAADWTGELQRKNCGFEHLLNNNYGENLLIGTSGYFDAKSVVDS